MLHVHHLFSYHFYGNPSHSLVEDHKKIVFCFFHLHAPVKLSSLRNLFVILNPLPLVTRGKRTSTQETRSEIF